MEYGEEFGPGAADDITPNKILAEFNLQMQQNSD